MIVIVNNLAQHTSNLEQVLNSLALLEELVGSDGHLLSLILVDSQSVDNAPLAVLDSHWEAVEKTLGNLIGVSS